MQHNACVLWKPESCHCCWPVIAYWQVSCAVSTYQLYCACSLAWRRPDGGSKTTDVEKLLVLVLYLTKLLDMLQTQACTTYAPSCRRRASNGASSWALCAALKEQDHTAANSMLLFASAWAWILMHFRRHKCRRERSRGESKKLQMEHKLLSRR